MRLEGRTLVGTALLLLSVPAQAKHHAHGLSHLEVLEKKHSYLRKAHASPSADAAEADVKVKRSTQCAFPTDAGLVAVTPDQENAGWAMSPNQPCKPGNYCPYACPSGQLMAQWDPKATSYTYPLSMNGGLYCDSNGQMSKPFPEKPYCYDGTGTVGVKNNAGKIHAVCQTTLPGNEAMLIPTEVDTFATLAVPGMDYWCSTAAHYYHNPPGTTTEDGCTWGDGSQPIGNWAPYVSGANTDSSGNTFVKIAWNPIYTNSDFASTLPDWGLKIECNGGGCNGLPCTIDPSVNSVNEVTSDDQSSGAGGANFCVVTVPKGGSADIVVFAAGDSGSSSGSASSSESAAPSSSSAAASSTSPTPTPTSTSTTSAPTSTSTSSSSPQPTTSSTSSSTIQSTSTSSPSSSSATSQSSSSSSSEGSSSSSSSASSSSSSATTLSSSSSSASATIANAPHVLFQNTTNFNGSLTGAASTTVKPALVGTAVGAVAAASTTSKAAAPSTFDGNSAFGIFVAMAVGFGYLI